MKNKKALLIVIVGGLFLLVDQFLKHLSLNAWHEPVMYNNIFGWSPFLNSGVAFGIKIPNQLVVVLSIAIIIFLEIVLEKKLNQIRRGLTKSGDLASLAGITFLSVGAISNLIGRLWLGSVIDYLRFFTAIINLGDVMIVAGFVLYLATKRKEKSERPED